MIPKKNLTNFTLQFLTGGGSESEINKKRIATEGEFDIS